MSERPLDLAVALHADVCRAMVGGLMSRVLQENSRRHRTLSEAPDTMHEMWLAMPLDVAALAKAGNPDAYWKLVEEQALGTALAFRRGVRRNPQPSWWRAS